MDRIAAAGKAKKARRMNTGTVSGRWVAVVCLILLGGGMSTNSMGGVTDFAKAMAERAMKPRHAEWKEEILLHDGRKLIVERSQTYGGYSTLESRERSLVREEWTFRTPDGGQKVVWKSDFRRPPEGDSLMLLRLDFLNGVPYVATTPAGCLAYNHWKRPNPPYLFFKYDGKSWRQISLTEFPEAFRESNVAVGRPDLDHRKGVLSVDTIKEENRLLQPHLKQIMREPFTAGAMGCPVMVRIKGGWASPDGAKSPIPIKPAVSN